MPWFQRKARPWDDHWDLFLTQDPSWLLPRPFVWTVPDTWFLEILQVRMLCRFALVGFGTKHAPYIECRRSDVVRWNTTYPDRTETNINFFVNWSTKPYYDHGSAQVSTIYLALPGTCYVQPGDVLVFDWWNHQAGDSMGIFALTAKGWKIY